MATDCDEDEPFVDNNHNIMAYGDVKNNNSSSTEYDSDTSLSSTHSSKSIEIRKEGLYNNGYMVEKKKSLIKILQNASKSRYNPSNFDTEIMSSLSELSHPPNDKRSFIWGIILMFTASFLFSISTSIIKYKHSFGRESFEIFVFRMFIQLIVTTMVASISVVIDQYNNCYESVAMFSTTEVEGIDTETETEYDSDEYELGQLKKKIKKIKKYSKNKNNYKKNKKTHILYNILRGQYKFQKPCCQIRCKYITTVFAKFWTDSSTQTKLYIVLRGICGGTGAVCYYWSVAILPINDTIFILSLFPIFTTIFSYFILHEKITNKHILYLCLAITGILLLLYPSFIFGRDDIDDNMYNINHTNTRLLIQGYSFAVISSICYGFVFIFIRLAYKAPTFSLIFSNGLFGLFEAILICIIFKRFVPIPMWKDWVCAIVLGCIGYLAQNAENRSGKYVYASLTSIIRVTEVFWQYIWNSMFNITSINKSIQSIQSIGAFFLVMAIILIMGNKYNQIKDIEISNALEGVIDYEYDTEYDTDNINYIYHKKDDSSHAIIKNKAAHMVNKICGVNSANARKQKYQKIHIDIDAI